MNFTQDNRPLSITDFSLGKDTFLATSLTGTEEISGLYEFEITALSENHQIEPDKIVGKTCTVSSSKVAERHFHGYIRSFSFGEIQEHNLREYRMVMVPWLWFLTRTNNHRIFQQKNVKQIVSTIFSDLGFSDFEFRASGGKTREYCVQHNESDFVFVSRLLEEEGISYFFEQSKNSHKLIIVDDKSPFSAVGEASVAYSKGASDEARISEWVQTNQYRKGVWTLNDYNFKEPKKSLLATATTTSKFDSVGKFEHYEYADMYDYGYGADLAKARIIAEETDINVSEGISSCATFFAGGTFELAKHDTASQKGNYTLASVTHHITENTYLHKEEGESEYINRFACVPIDVFVRPKKQHHKPFMRGPQSALVTGPAGEEIHVDELGRIKVQFYWDREGNKDDASSCYIRVMQSWAGNGWGASFIPRIGHEVIVEFIDGDPDRPIITGTVYNGVNAPPFDSKTQSGIRTRSTKGGAKANFNELRFDDKKDAEQIYIHAEKNLDTRVENDETLTVDHDRIKQVKNDESYTIGNDRTKNISGNQVENIGKDKTTTVGQGHQENIEKDQSVMVGDNRKLTVGSNLEETINQSITISIGKDHTESINGGMSLQIGKDAKESVGGKQTIEVVDQSSLSAKKVLVQAKDEIVFQAGSAKVQLKSNGDINITGGKINVNGSGNVKVKGSKTSIN